MNSAISPAISIHERRMVGAPVRLWFSYATRQIGTRFIGQSSTGKHSLRSPLVRPAGVARGSCFISAIAEYIFRQHRKSISICTQRARQFFLNWFQVVWVWGFYRRSQITCHDLLRDFYFFIENFISATVMLPRTLWTINVQLIYPTLLFCSTKSVASRTILLHWIYITWTGTVKIQWSISNWNASQIK